MEKCVQAEMLKNLRSVYSYLNQPLPPSFEKYVKCNCNEDFVKLAGNERFQRYIISLDPFSNRYLEFKRIYHKLLIDLYKNQKDT